MERVLFAAAGILFSAMPALSADIGTAYMGFCLNDECTITASAEYQNEPTPIMGTVVVEGVDFTPIYNDGGEVVGIAYDLNGERQELSLLLED